MPIITVHEFARLTTAKVSHISLDEATVSKSAFDWLVQETARLSPSGADVVCRMESTWLRIESYVGVLKTPCGTVIEILPKTTRAEEDTSVSRRHLRKMISKCMGLPPRVSSVADIDAFHGPLTEWVSRQFLVALDYLTKRGVRFEYHSEEDQQRYLRGRLLIDRQVREPPGRRYCFHIRHDVFDANRPENRLIQSALGEVLQHTADPGNWRLARELSGLWADVPASTNVGEDFSRWRSERLLAHYEPVRSWTRLILEQMTPMSMIGKWSGNSMLFPMERLFETYVGTCLGRSAPAGTSVKRSASTEHLCQHRGEPLFLLKPDFLVSNKSKKRILDTKWKLLDSRMNDATGKYGLAQSDFYQMLAYGQKYLGGKGDMFLIFPRTRQFSDSLPEFRFTEDLRLWVVPFDLETDSLVGVAAEALWILDAA